MHDVLILILIENGMVINKKKITIYIFFVKVN